VVRKLTRKKWTAVYESVALVLLEHMETRSTQVWGRPGWGRGFVVSQEGGKMAKEERFEEEVGGAERGREKQGKGWCGWTSVVGTPVGKGEGAAAGAAQGEGEGKTDMCGGEEDVLAQERRAAVGSGERMAGGERSKAAVVRAQGMQGIGGSSTYVSMASVQGIGNEDKTPTIPRGAEAEETGRRGGTHGGREVGLGVGREGEDEGARGGDKKIQRFDKQMFEREVQMLMR
jgi:hypothetical protein